MSPVPDREALVRQLRQIRHISRCRGADLDRARLEIAATRARAAAFASQQEVALLRVAALEQAVAELRAEIARLEQHRDEALLLRKSLSWRVTSPLRALRRSR